MASASDSGAPQLKHAGDVLMSGIKTEETLDKAFNEEDKSHLDYSYEMKHDFRGCFMILNHYKFKNPDLRNRDGTEVDCVNLKNTAKALGFEFVRSFPDLTKEKIIAWVKAIASADHSRFDCFAMAVLTHGSDKDELWAYDEEYHVDDLIMPFMAENCSSLAGKPKLFFIQACRGKKLDPGHRMLAKGKGDTVDGVVSPIADIIEDTIVIPNSADFLLAYSTIPGYYAWRNTINGSCFIRALCECLKNFRKLELMQIMTRVNRQVAYEFESHSDKKNFDRKKQIPSVITRLTHDLYF